MIHAAPSRVAPRPDVHMRAPDGWRALPIGTRLYVGAVTLAGLFVLAVSAPGVLEQDPELFAALLLLSVVASTTKISLPVPKSVSTLTVCYVVDYTAVLLMGPHAAAFTAAAGAWSQCTFKSRYRNPAHQTLFSVASLALSVYAAGVMYTWRGGHHLQWGASIPVEPLIAAGTVFFLLNTILIAGAVGLATRQSVTRVWTENFLWSWPGYLIGAGVAAGAAVAIERSGFWLLPLAGIPLALTWHSFKTYIRRFNESQTDSLTGLPNSRFLISHAGDEIARAQRDRTPLSLLVIDLDGFKKINDTHGHRAGDAALRHAARVLAGALGDRGVCARYGGDEFVCVLPQCDADQARRVQAELRSAVDGSAFEIRAGKSVSLALSAGGAVLGHDGAAFDELLAAADARMFHDKAERRRRSTRRPRAVAGKHAQRCSAPGIHAPLM